MLQLPPTHAHIHITGADCNYPVRPEGCREARGSLSMCPVGARQFPTGLQHRRDNTVTSSRGTKSPCDSRTVSALHSDTPLLLHSLIILYSDKISMVTSNSRGGYTFVCACVLVEKTQPSLLHWYQEVELAASYSSHGPATLTMHRLHFISTEPYMQLCYFHRRI